MKALITLGAIICLHLCAPNAYASNSTATSSADTPKTVQQRADFIAAREALRDGRTQQYQALAQKLRDYPLYPYLEYWDLNRNLGSASAAQIDAFVKRYGDLYLSARLQQNWLEKIAEQGDWALFLRHYTPGSNTQMECYRRRALYKNGDKKAAFDGMESLWLVGKSQPRACDPLFAAWQEAGHLTHELAWQRTALALEAGEVYLAKYLERFLDTEKRSWSELWREIHRHPEKLVDTPKLRGDNPIVRTILAHGVRRMTRNNPSQAAATWDSLVMKHTFTQEERKRSEAHIAVALARKRAPEATQWLGNADSDDEKVREWRILNAINQDDWDKAIFWIEQLPADEQQSLRWRYWLARAYEKSGKGERAQLIYAEIAKARDYYAFMAADRIDSGYDFENRPLQFSPEELNATENLPGMKRTREFYRMGDMLYARREWYATVSALDDKEVQKVARIIHDWGWHDRAILSLAQVRYFDDLEIRFPLAHREQVSDNAATQQIDPAWAYAVIRQESAFASSARSPKGAMGLMQIMPGTGEVIARDLNTRLKDKLQLLDVDTNIRFGISYLRKVLNRFDQNTVLATAAYNAGSERVKSWLPDEEQDSADRWIENVPFAETRGYLKNVLAYSAIYDKRMQRPVVTLKERMPEIPPSQTPAL